MYICLIFFFCPSQLPVEKEQRYLQVVRRGRREAEAGGGQQPLVRVVHPDAVGLRAV